MGLVNGSAVHQAIGQYLGQNQLYLMYVLPEVIDYSVNFPLTNHLNPVPLEVWKFNFLSILSVFNQQKYFDYTSPSANGIYQT